MPSMLDPNFHKTVTYICEHTEHGALGIVINRPLDMDLGEIFQQLALGEANPEMARQSRAARRAGTDRARIRYS